MTTTPALPADLPTEVTATDRPRPDPRSRGPAAETDLSLLLDVGTAWTKAALVGRAGGRWRIVSGTSQPSSWGEAVLVDDLVGRLAPHADPRLSQRLALLVRDAPRITCRSPRRPGRLVVVADTESDHHAAAATASRSGWTVVAAVAATDRRSDAERYDLLRSAESDAWLAVSSSGPPHGALWGLAVAAWSASGVPVLAAGAESGRESLPAIFGPAAQWLGPIRDDVLADTLLTLLAQSNGLGDKRSLAPLAFGRSMGTLARGLGLGVLGVDLGSTWLAWGSGSPETGASTALFGVLDRVTTDGSRVAAEMLPTDVDEFATTDATANLAARPVAVPASPNEAVIAQAFGVDRLAAARRRMGGCPPVDLVVGGGRLLAGAAHPADAALVLLDGLRPAGVTQLTLDPWGICGPLGSLSAEDMDEGMETLRDDLLVPLGTSVVSHGGRPGQVAFQARLRRPGWPDSARFEVRSGAVVVLPLERGAMGELEIEIERGATLGQAHRGRRFRVAVTGGAVGVILDARDDPIALPSRPGDARTMIESWRATLRRDRRPAAG